MKELSFITKKIDTDSITNLTFSIPIAHVRAIQNFFDSQKGDTFRLRISPPFKPRSTGPGSQNSHANGHCQQIAEESGHDFGYIKRYCKLKAISRGYPYKTGIEGEVVPYSETKLDTTQAGYFIEAIHEVAAFLSIRLRED